MTPELTACAALVERGDPERFLVAMAAPPAAREALFPLYAFNVEIARAPWVTQEPIIAEMRLQWWRDAVEEIVAGGPPRAHEVVGPLSAVIRAHALPGDLFDQAIAARRWDIYRDPFEDASHFEAHIDRTAGNLLWLSCLALGARAAQESAVRDAGYAAGVAAWLVAVPALGARGRIPLVDEGAPAVAALARDALTRLARARQVGFGTAIPAMRACWQAGPLLRQAARAPERVAAGTLGTSPFRKRGALLWKTITGRW